MTRQMLWKERQAQKNRCVDCGEKAVTNGVKWPLCQKHVRVRRKYQRAYQQQGKWRAYAKRYRKKLRALSRQNP